MFKVGLFVGKFLPPHMGHLWAINEAAKQCEKLFVLVCDNPQTVVPFCKDAGWPVITLGQRLGWVREQLAPLTNVVVLGMDESGIEMQPFEWEAWANRVRLVIGEQADAIFGSELNYKEGYEKHFPESRYVLQDPERKNVSIHGVQIRKDLERKLSYVIPVAREYFKEFVRR